MTTPFKELAGSPVETLSTTGIRAQRQLLCAWEDRWTLAAELLGGGNAPAGYPGRPGVLAVQVKIEPFHGRPDDQGAFRDVGQQINSYSGQFAAVTVDYQLLSSSALAATPVVDPSTVLSYRVDSSAEYQAVTAQGLQWLDQPNDAAPTQTALAIRVPVVNHHLTWQRVASPPWSAMRRCVGCVNGDTFLGAAPGTVLCDGVQADQELYALAGDGSPRYAWRIDYQFKEKVLQDPTLAADAASAGGWNDLSKAAAGGSDGVGQLVDAQGNALYRTADFGRLFVQDAGYA